MKHNIAAHIERILQIRRGKGVVYAHQRAGGFGFGGQRFDIHQPQQRVGRRFQPQHFHFLRRQNGVEALRIGEVGKHHVDAPRGIHFGEQIISAAINIGHGYDGVARA